MTDINILVNATIPLILRSIDNTNFNFIIIGRRAVHAYIPICELNNDEWDIIIYKENMDAFIQLLRTKLDLNTELTDKRANFTNYKNISIKDGETVHSIINIYDKRMKFNTKEINGLVYSNLGFLERDSQRTINDFNILKKEGQKYANKIYDILRNVKDITALVSISLDELNDQLEELQGNYDDMSKNKFDNIFLDKQEEFNNIKKLMVENSENRDILLGYLLANSINSIFTKNICFSLRSYEEQYNKYIKTRETIDNIDKILNIL